MARVPSALLIVALVLCASSGAVAQTCRAATSCSECLANPACGWCASYQDCVPGSAIGPNVGTCADWDFYKCTGPPPPAGGDWPMFGGGAGHSNYLGASFDGMRPTPTMNVTLLHGGHASASIYVGGTVYTVVANTTSKAALVGINLATGLQTVHVPIGSPSSFSPPAASHDGSTLYVSTVGANEGRVLYAIDLATASVAWQGTGASQWGSYSYGPTVSASGDVYMLDGEYDGMLHGFSSTGKSLFDAAYEGTAAGDDSSTPSLWTGDKDAVYWTTAPGEGNPGAVGAVSGTTGAKLWTVGIPSSWDGYSTMAVMAIADSAGVGVATSRTGATLTTTAVSLKGGQVAWGYNCSKPTTLAPGTFTDYSPATDGVSVAAVTCSDGVHMLDLTTGKSMKTLACTGCSGQPLITKDTVFVQSSGGVKAFNLGTGFGQVITPAPGTFFITGTSLVVTDTDTATVNVVTLAHTH